MNLSSSLSYCTTNKALHLLRDEVDVQLAKIQDRLPGAIKKVGYSQEIVAKKTTIQAELLELKNTSRTYEKDSTFRFKSLPATDNFSYLKLPTTFEKFIRCGSPKSLLDISKPTFEHLCESELTNLTIKHSHAKLSNLIDHKIQINNQWKNFEEGDLQKNQSVLTKLEDKKAELIALKEGLKSGLYKVTDKKDIADTTKIEFIETIDKLINNPAMSDYVRQCMNIAPLNDNDLRKALSLLDSSKGSPEPEVQNERLRAASLLTDSELASLTLYASCKMKNETSKVLENWNTYDFAPLKPAAPNNTIFK